MAETRRAELMREYKTLAKKADRRLRELERISKEQDFKDATNWAYAKAMSDIEHRWGEGETRFDKRLPKDWKVTSMIAALNEVKSFLEMPSSTKTGIISTYQKRAETLNQRYGTNLSWQQLGKLFENNTFDKLLNKYTSAQIFKQIGRLQRSEGKIRKSIREADDKIKRVTKEDVMSEILEILGKQEMSIENLV